MKLSNQKITLGLSATATPAGDQNTAKADVGTVTTYPLPAANAIYAVQVAAAAAANAATLTLATGVCAQTTGSPVITGGEGKDFQAKSWGTLGQFHGIRIRTAAGNLGTVTLAGTSSGLLPALVLGAGCDLVLCVADAGVMIVGTHTLLTTFSHSGDTLNIEVLAEDTSL